MTKTYEGNLHQINGKVYPDKAASYFSSEVNKALTKYQFKAPPFITLNGLVDTKNNLQTDLDFTFISKSTLNTELLEKRLVIDNPKGTVKINGENLNVALEGEFVGGVFKHIGSINLSEKEKHYNGRIQADNFQFGDLVKTFDFKSKYPTNNPTEQTDFYYNKNPFTSRIWYSKSQVFWNSSIRSFQFFLKLSKLSDLGFFFIKPTSRKSGLAIFL